MLEKRFNGIEKETVKRYRQVDNGRQIRLVRHMPKKENTELAFSSLRACLVIMKNASLSRNRMHPLPRKCTSICVYEEEEEEEKEEEEDEEEKEEGKRRKRRKKQAEHAARELS